MTAAGGPESQRQFPQARIIAEQAPVQGEPRPGSPQHQLVLQVPHRRIVLSVEKFTIPPKEPRACIDFILALRNKAKFKFVGSDVPTVFKNGDVTIASDHLPVYVDVKL